MRPYSLVAATAAFCMASAAAFVAPSSTFVSISSERLACSGTRVSMVAGIPAEFSDVARPNSRAQFLAKGAAAAAAMAAWTAAAPSAFAAEEIMTASGLKIKKLKTSTAGQVAEVGDLAAVRFKGTYKGFTFDDIFDTPEPLYFRVGGGNLVKGIDEAVLMMRVGDRWELTCPGPLAFGEKGRPPSPNKPRIPPMAVVVYELELVALPGKEEDILDISDDPYDVGAAAGL